MAENASGQITTVPFAENLGMAGTATTGSTSKLPIRTQPQLANRTRICWNGVDKGLPDQEHWSGGYPTVLRRFIKP